MILVDTSVWIQIFRDKSGNVTSRFQQITRDRITVLTRFNQLEILQGAKNLDEWKLLDDYLSTQFYLETSEQSWRDAAKIYFDLRRNGLTVRSPIDCCIAQCALENQVLLLHQDKDFETISQVRDLKQARFQ